MLAAACVLIAFSGCGQPSGDTVILSSEPDPTHPLHASDAPAPPVVAYAARIHFGVSGGSEALKQSGWLKPEADYTWSTGSAAIIAARVEPTPTPVVLRFTAGGLIKVPELPFQPVTLYVNNRKVADLQIGHTAEFIFVVPQRFTKRGGLLTITFHTPNATSPRVLGNGSDERVLGIRLFELTFEQVR